MGDGQISWHDVPEFTDGQADYWLLLTLRC